MGCRGGEYGGTADGAAGLASGGILAGASGKALVGLGSGQHDLRPNATGGRRRTAAAWTSLPVIGGPAAATHRFVQVDRTIR
ncbi:hypothetical protein GCM10020366_68570 [Saccharopolyspora gregorii]|uniref:Uncharacterized protein n=1 Tax=Saccharopolyspora gregorii TaxID=33914 RepID=A0ABP6S2D2_9PSEU